MLQNNSTSIDIGFLKRMGYEFNENETECRPKYNGIAKTIEGEPFEFAFRPVSEVIDDYIDFWHNSDQDVKNPIIYKGL